MDNIPKYAIFKKEAKEQNRWFTIGHYELNKAYEIGDPYNPKNPDHIPIKAAFNDQWWFSREWVYLVYDTSKIGLLLYD